MQLINLKIKNLFSFADTQLDFSKFKSGVIFVEGINNDNPSSSVGSGKTSIWEVINWILFDDTIKGETKDKILRAGTHSGGAELTFKEGDHIVKVCKSRGKLRRMQVFVDGKDRKLKTVTECLKFLREFIGVDFNVYRNSILLGQDDKNRLLYGTDKARKDLVGGVLNFFKIDKALEHVRTEHIRSLSKDISFVDRTIEMLMAEKEQQGTTIAILKDNIHSVDGRIDKIKKRIKHIQKKLKDFGDIEKIKARKHELAILYNDLKQEIAKSTRAFQKLVEPEKKKLSQLEFQYSDLKGVLVDPKQIRSSIKRDKGLRNRTEKLLNDTRLEMARLKENIKINNNNIEQMEDKVNQFSKSENVLCPYCGQKIKEKCLWKLKNEIADNRVKNKKTNVRLEELERRSKKATKRISELDELIKSSKERIKKCELKRILRKDIASLKKYIIGMNESWHKERKQVQKRFVPISSELDVVKRKLENEEDYNKLKKEEQTVTKSLESEQKRRESLLMKKNTLVRIIKKLKKFMAKREKLSNKEKISRHLEKLFGQDGFRVLLLNSIVPIVSQKVSDYLTMLESDHIKLTMNINSKNEFVIDVVVLNDVGEETVVPLNLFSGGEKKLLTFLFNLSLGEIVMERKHGFDYLVLDEITDGLDSLYNQQVMEMLMSMAERDRKRIFIISHRQETRDILESFKVQKITVEKRHGKSIIRQQ